MKAKDIVVGGYYMHGDRRITLIYKVVEITGYNILYATYRRNGSATGSGNRANLNSFAKEMKLRVKPKSRRIYNAEL